jgi:DNA-binding transcriptional MerR regulator/methylmalonyl-CoA mutase cobalamin-binding subunit
MNDGKQYSMKVVVRRTGLTPHVIRIWERRYGAVTPTRTATKRRLYADADIERLQVLRKLTLAGHSISRIARLPIGQLVALTGADELSEATLPGKLVAHQNGLLLASHMEACLAAVRQMNAEVLEEVLARAAVSFSQPVLLENIIAPLMQQIGDLWHTGRLRMAHEHLASEVVRHFLWNMRGSIAPASAPGLFVTTPTGQVHEIGALIIATVARMDGWKVTYLGPNLPAEEIAAVVLPGVKAVALSIVYPPDDHHLSQELIRLRRGLAEEVAILVGGRAADAYRTVLAAIGAERLGSLAELRTRLATLRT